MAWFTHNCHNPTKKRNGALTTDEVLEQEEYWIQRAQKQFVNTEEFFKDKEQLNLQLSNKGIWRCHGRLGGEYSIYLPDQAKFTSKLVQRAHFNTLHGGVGLIMAHVR